jgi:hypothetical protein
MTCCHFSIVEVTEVEGYPQGGVSLLLVNWNAGGIIVLWKIVLITGKVEIGGAAVQMELRGVTDKRMLYLVAGGR